MKKVLPWTTDQITTLTQKYPTPFYVYDEQGIRHTTSTLLQSAKDVWLDTYTNYYAVKALPNPHIMQIMKDLWCGFDCSSFAELLLCERTGVANALWSNNRPRIFFTSNQTSATDFQKAFALGAVINFDAPELIDYYMQHVGIAPTFAALRYNPGGELPYSFANKHIIGDPAQAKFGMTKTQIIASYRKLQSLGVKNLAIHMMLASNEIRNDVLESIFAMGCDMVLELKALGIDIALINRWGGRWIPYLPTEDPIDVQSLIQSMKRIYDEKLVVNGLWHIQIANELGRYITWPHGYLITHAIHSKVSYKNYIGLDATMANLMRPGMYGAYHHITVLGKESLPPTYTYDIVWSLCENNDKFAIDRELPEIVPWDIVIFHDAGAHGHTMGYNYNGTLRSAEVLFHADGSDKLIRRAETYDDLFATIV